MRAPAVDGADQPAEGNFRGDVPDRLVRGCLPRLVVHEQENARDELDGEKEQGGPAQVVPDHRVPADRHLLVPCELDQLSDAESRVEPAIQALADGSGRFRLRLDHAFSIVRSTSFPSRVAIHFTSGRGGGPERTRPSRSNLPLWQAHQSSESPGTN